MYNVMMRTAYPNELYHSGVKGQKWGVRRYQNPDGSLTAEGKKRYNKSYVKKIDDTIEKRQKTDSDKDRALSAITDKSVTNLIKTMAGTAISSIAGSALGTGTSLAGAALGSLGVMSAGTIFPIVGGAVSIGMMAKGIYNEIQLNKARKYYNE